MPVIDKHIGFRPHYNKSYNPEGKEVYHRSGEPTKRNVVARLGKWIQIRHSKDLDVNLLLDAADEIELRGEVISVLRTECDNMDDFINYILELEDVVVDLLIKKDFDV